jgi:hypothetical protein
MIATDIDNVISYMLVTELDGVVIVTYYDSASSYVLVTDLGGVIIVRASYRFGWALLVGAH